MVGVERVADHLAIRKSSFLHFWVVVFEGDKKLHKLQTPIQVAESDEFPRLVAKFGRWQCIYAGFSFVSSRKAKVVQFWGSRAVRAVAAGPLQKSLISLGKMR